MGTFQLDPAREELNRRVIPSHRGLGSSILLHNARWFTKVRWLVVAVFILMGLTSRFFPDYWRQIGLIPPSRWPWTIAAVLAVANTYFCVVLRRLKDTTPPLAVEINTGLQIVVDLLGVTALVHFVGSVDTFICFIYLFHVVLACIFFPKSRSLLVTLFAATLYFGCIVLELFGVLPPSGILAGFATFHRQSPIQYTLQAVSAIALWFVVWYLVSTLSEAVRRHDQDLAAANQRLRAASAEKNQIVLQTTHDLKAPFSGMQSNIDLLKTQYWNDIPGPVQEIVERIQTRAHTLSERIRDILVLGDLRSSAARREVIARLDISALMQSVTQDLMEKAKSRNVTIELKADPVFVSADSKQLNILFSNLVANAVYYSHEGGVVQIAVSGNDAGAHVSIADHGIGIDEEALPHIFDEYYRTSQAAQFNKLSTGLGLSIVKQISINLGLRIAVESGMDKGTTFSVEVPFGTARAETEVANGEDQDHR